MELYKKVLNITIALYTSVLLEPKFITRIHLAVHNGKDRNIKMFSNLDKCTN